MHETLYETEVHGVFTTSAVTKSLYPGEPMGPLDEMHQYKCYAVTLDCWHQRLGHPSENVLRQLVDFDAAVGMRPTSDTLANICVPFLQAKQVRTMHKPSPSSVSNVLDLVHLDLMGPLPNRWEGLSIFL